jgi:hypothetical protein
MENITRRGYNKLLKISVYLKASINQDKIIDNVNRDRYKRYIINAILPVLQV